MDGNYTNTTRTDLYPPSPWLTTSHRRNDEQWVNGTTGLFYADPTLPTRHEPLPGEWLDGQHLMGPQWTEPIHHRVRNTLEVEQYLRTRYRVLQENARNAMFFSVAGDF